MKYLQITNLALLALGLVLTIVLAVESLIYTIYLGADPIVGRQLPKVLQMTAVLGAFSAAALLAYVGHRGQRSWRWVAQTLPVIAGAGVILSLVGLRS